LDFKLGDGDGATRPLPRNRGVEELHGDPTVGPRPKDWSLSVVCTMIQDQRVLDQANY